MRVHLLDGTYELFRHYFAVPKHTNARGEEVGAVRAVLGSVLGLLEAGVTHLGVATDHVIESFRNELWPGYKTAAGVPDDLLAQFPLLEDGLRALGVTVWPMVEFEADDALATAAAQADADPRVEVVVICTPDKDLAQCVRGQRVVQLDRRHHRVFGEEGVVERLGVRPGSVPDYLALVGDSADGFPGLPGFGAKTAAALLHRYGHLEGIPRGGNGWDVPVRNATALRRTLSDQWELAVLFRELAALRTDVPLHTTVDDLAWRGPTPEAEAWVRRLDAPGLGERLRTLSPAT